jgi:Pentapeptide repeats (8 copies)
MDSTIEAAIIGAGGAIVAGTTAAIVAVFGFRKSSTDNRETLEQTLNAAREGQLTDRYTKAVEHLGSDNLDVRIGGIYALQHIARDSPDIYHPMVIEVLATFVREHSHEQWPLPENETDSAPLRTTRPDVQAAANIVCYQDHITYLFDLTRVELPGAKLPSAKLRGVNFEGGAILDRANFINADLREARLSSASLHSTLLEYADLSGASLIGADLSYTTLKNVNLRGASLALAHFDHADFTAMDLTGVDLREADLNMATWPEHVAPPPGWKLNPLFKNMLMRDRRHRGLQETDADAEGGD